MIKLALALAACACALHGQDSARPKNTYHSTSRLSAQPRLISPEVNPDRTVVFRLRAPQATMVQLMFSATKPMTKDAAGIWTATVGPVEPEIYQYNFLVDGVRILDPSNPNLKNGRALDSSTVEVPGTPPRFDELQAYRTAPSAFGSISRRRSRDRGSSTSTRRRSTTRSLRGDSQSFIFAMGAGTPRRTGATRAAPALSWTISSHSTKRSP